MGDVGLDIFITEEDFLPLNIKQIKIQFQDQLSTKLRFYVKRKPIKSTRTLKKLTFLVDKPTSTDNLELPIQLSQLLKDEIENCWKSRYIIDASTKKIRQSKTNLIDRSHAWKAKYFNC